MPNGYVNSLFEITRKGALKGGIGLRQLNFQTGF